jgi:hypothetical protein
MIGRSKMNERLPVMTSTRILLDVSVLLKKKMLKKDIMHNKNI